MTVVGGAGAVASGGPGPGASTHMRREVVNGIGYVQRHGVPGDAVKDLPPGSICYDRWRGLADGGHLDQINRVLVVAGREQAGRGASPTLAITDAQSVKCDAPQGERGHDAAQALAGRAVEVVERPEFTKGFVLLPKRWRVEQGVGALTHPAPPRDRPRDADPRLGSDHPLRLRRAAARVSDCAVTLPPSDSEKADRASFSPAYAVPRGSVRARRSHRKCAIRASRGRRAAPCGWRRAR